MIGEPVGGKHVRNFIVFFRTVLNVPRYKILRSNLHANNHNYLQLCE